jgi:hypothetical protein
MSTNKRLITSFTSTGDPRLDGLGSVATAKWVGTDGTQSGILRYRSNNNPNGSYSSVTVGSAALHDALWDGFTWTLATGNGIYQTSDSSCATGWTLVAGAGIGWGQIVPVPGGILVFRVTGTSAGALTMAYTSTVDGTVSSSNWATKNTGITGYCFAAIVTSTKVVIGRRYDSGSGPQFYYNTTDEDWFIDSGLTGWQLSGSPPWGTRLSTDGTAIVGARRGYNGVFYAASPGASTTNQAMGSDYWMNLHYTNGYWTSGQSTASYYKTSYNASWTTGASATSTYYSPFYYNGTYWVSGMNYANDNNQAVAYRSSITNSNSYITQSTLGTSSGGYMRFFRPSLMSKFYAWTNLGSSSPTFG